MFKEIPGGTFEIINKLKCWIPKKPATHLIANYDLPKKQQKFIHTPLPDQWDEWREEEEQQLELDPEYTHSQIEQFKEQEWTRRLNGYWFFINGQATYITGKHYFYLNWWKLDSGLPEYRDTDRKLFYFWQYCIDDPNCYGMVEMTMRRQGKCFAKDTLIRMYDGAIKNVQDIIAGDLVMGNDSASRIAYGITKGREEMYRISPNKGDSFICNKSHILSLIYNNNAPCINRGWASNGVVNISVEDYLNCTESEKGHLVLYRSGWGDNYEEKYHIIHPYIFGAWLGDGHKHAAKFSSNDKEIISAFYELADQESLKVFKSKKYDYRLVLSRERKSDGSYVDKRVNNPVKSELHKLGVLNDKHIPKEYLIDSKQNRLELLAGIIDTDGYLDRNRKGVPSSYEITQKSKKAADDIVELSRSLGFYTSINIKKASMKRPDNTMYHCNVYRIKIYGELEIIPCRLDRKKATSNSIRVNSLRTGFKVENIGDGDYYGFAVDDNHLFLLADGTVVHNTYRGACEMYEELSRPPQKMSGGVQSKTGMDAAELFEEKLIEPWKDLPDFFKPESNSGTDPKKVLRFARDITKGRKAKKVKQNADEELRNFIDWKPAKEKAYDGKAKRRMFFDECGKTNPTEEADVHERHRVIKPCLVKNGKIWGKAYLSTTVEELSEGGEQFKKIWDESDPNKKDDNGETESGLYRYFLSALEGTFYDEYGYSDIEKSKKKYDATRKALKDKPNELASLIRKFPYDEDEPFIADGDHCEFNALILSKRLQELEIKEPVTIGDFEWTNGRDSKVIFVPNPNGKFKVAWLPFNDNETNLVDKGPIITKPDGTLIQTWIPLNDKKFRAGEDPVDMGYETVDKRVSDTALYVKQLFDIVIDKDPSLVYTEETCGGFEYKIGKVRWKTNRYIIEYIARNDDPTDSYEDTIKVIRFCGCSIYPETNKAALKIHLTNRGYGPFIKYRPKDTWTNDSGNQNTPGVASVEPIIQQYLQLIKSYVNNYGHLIPFKRQVKDLIAFRRSKIRLHDATVAMGFTEMACLGEAKYVPVAAEVHDYFRTYKVNGNQTELSN